MISQEQMKDLIDSRGSVVSDDGHTLGPMGQLFVDDKTGQPTWITVTTGRVGNPETFVPLQGAAVDGENVRVPYTREAVQSSPDMSQDGHLSPEEEKHLLRHYRLIPGVDGVGSDAHPAAERSLADRASRRELDDAMTRSEEQLRVHTEIRPTERVRLIKRVVTENVTLTVPVRREELVIERIPTADVVGQDGTGARKGSYTDVDRDELYAAVGSAFDGSEVEIVLHEERAIVHTEIVAIERVRLNKEVITRDETVSGEVRKEVIEADRSDFTGSDLTPG